MKAECRKLLAKLPEIDQAAIAARIEEQEKLAGASITPEERGRIASAVIDDHLATLQRTRTDYLSQLGEGEKPPAPEKKADPKAVRRVESELFNALRFNTELPTLATAGDDVFDAKARALAARWVEEQRAIADPERVEILSGFQVDSKLIAALRREAVKQQKAIAEEERKKDAKAPKLRNTGEDLRRHWELVKAELQAKNDAEGITGLNKIFAATTRADLFAGAIPEDATPGTHRYSDLVRDEVFTFKEWATNGAHSPLTGMSGHFRWRRAGGEGDRIAAFIKGEGYFSGDRMREEFTAAGIDTGSAGNTQELTVQQRLDFVRYHADRYMNLVRLMVDPLRGKRTVAEASDALTNAIWAKPFDPNSWSLLGDPENLTDAGKEIREGGLLGRRANTIHSTSYNVRGLKAEENETRDAQRKKPLTAPRLESITREQLPTVREGNVSPKQFKDEFGFSDVGFGSWVKSAEDQAHLNHAWDAFADLARFVGIERKQIGFGGRLHFTLGALGHGSKAAATFHPGHPGPNGIVQVINLTKTQGDGTVAHEWLHALDHFLRYSDPGTQAMNELVHGLKEKYDIDAARAVAVEGLRKRRWMMRHKNAPPLENARNLLDYYQHRGVVTDFKRHADAMDPKYWGNDRELPARAWEAWVADTLGGVNNYLVNPSWVGEGLVKAPTYKGTPYPTGEERKAFADWFSALVKSLTIGEEGITVDRAKWNQLKPKHRQEYQEAVEAMKADLPLLWEQLQREDAAKATGALAAARQKADAEAAAALAASAEKREREAATPPPAVTPAGELSEGALEDVFDSAAESARAEAHEDPTAPDPGEPAFTGEKAPPSKASTLIAEAAKQGVKGIDETLTALTKLFGGGKIQSFPGGFDDDAYKAAKPHFEAALKAFQEAGKSLKDLFKLLIEQFGEGIKPYAIRFAQDMKLTANLGAAPSASKNLAVWVKGQLNRPGAAHLSMIHWQKLFERADEEFGGTQAQGKYTPKDAYDAAEAGMNLWILENAERAFQMDTEAAGARAALEVLKDRTSRLPTQTKRTGEQDEFQQFSTVPALAYMANWVANVQEGETMGEPSAGIGGLAAFAKASGATVVLNELSARRAAVLREVLPDARIFSENAERIADILPDDTRPTVVVMNPPFSATAGRMEGTRDSMVGAQHVESALAWLKPGGRLVAIVGKGMAEGEPRFAPWWAKIKERYNVRAILSLNGGEYAKYGTTYDNVLFVIDKTGPTTGAVVTGRVEEYNALPALLEGVRNDRAAPLGIDSAPEPATAQPGSGEAPAPGLGESVQPPRPDTGSVGNGAGNPPGAGGAGNGTGGGRTRPGNGVGRGGAGRKRGAGTGSPGEREPGGGSGLDLGVDQRPNERLTLDAGAIEKRAAELTDSIFETYEPSKARINGSQPHPGKLVESAAMAAVQPIDPTYVPNLPREAIEKGYVSSAQLEAVIYAGQAHTEMLPNGKRKGYFIGDGTGVGKGREISAILLDNMRQGRKKAVWLSASAGLVRDAKRDFGGVTGRAPEAVSEIFELRDTKNGGAGPAGKVSRGDGIMFLTYDTLKGGEKAEQGKTPQTSLNQIIEWVGPEFDGVIAFDEAHKMKNLGGQKGSRGKTKPAMRALIAQDLRDKLPNARIVYVSATGATEVSNLGYADRLGLWGANTAFPDANTFSAQIGAAGIASMELVARDMKAMGVYISRSLSYDGVEQTTIDASFSPLQKEIYDELAKAWQIVLRNMNEALKTTGQDKNGQAKGAARSAFWSTQQRFFNQVITAMMTPYVLDSAKAALNDGHSVIFQLVNTNEATQERLVEAAEGNDTPLEELDFTPKQSLIEYLRKSFPVAAFEEFTDDNGQTRSRPVHDSQGNVVVSREAEAQRDALIKHIEDNLRVPENPIDLIYEALGDGQVAEVSGRGRRFQKVMKKDGSFTLEERKRTGKSNEADAKAFMDGKKNALIFTDAGGTGYSFHSDLGAKNQRRRFHIMLQPGWVAENAMQGLGRSHRSNQANAPLVALPKSDLKAQKRFISSIARRLDQLGALTKGQRNAASQGLFTNKDNLESKYALAALRALIEDMAPGSRTSGTVLDAAELIVAMGLDEIYDAMTGAIIEGKFPTIQRFLNRLLSLTTKQQDQLFAEFEMRMDAAIDTAIKNGTFDDGMQTVKALKVHKQRDEVVHTDKKTGAQTHYVELELTRATAINTWETVKDQIQSFGEKRQTDFYFDTQSHQPFAIVNLGQRTSAKGQMEERGYRYNVRARSMASRGLYINNRDTYERGGDRAERRRDETGKLVPISASVSYEARKAMGVVSIPRFQKITEAEAEYLWGEAVEAAPKTEVDPLYMLTGALLPVWDRLDAGDDTRTSSVVRTQTDDGERLIGRVIGADDRTEILKRLGVGAVKSDMATAEIIGRILRGEIAQLANGWTIRRVKVSNETRMELIAGYLSSAEKSHLEQQGAFQERIGYLQRMFIPTGNPEAFERVTREAGRPVVDFLKPGRDADEDESGGGPSASGGAGSLLAGGGAQRNAAPAPKTERAVATERSPDGDQSATNSGRRPPPGPPAGPPGGEGDGFQRRAVNFVNDLVQSSKQFNWWDRTVGTQLHKASKNPWFRKVFERGQAYLHDVSEFAARSADMAPNILPRLDKLADLGKFGAKPQELKDVGRAIFAETLDRELFPEERLRKDFGLTDRTLGLYHEARKAINRSLDDLSASEWVRKTRNMGLEAAHAQVRAEPNEAAAIIGRALNVRIAQVQSRLNAYREDPAMEAARANAEIQLGMLTALRGEIERGAARINELKAQGYAPLMRFGKYSVHVWYENEDHQPVTAFFGLYESEREANAAARELTEEFPDHNVDRGIMSQEAWKLFNGVSPDTLEVFAKALGVEESPVFQEYLKLAVNNRSALKRLIKRKGTAGFSWDTSRVLATFVTSNARRAAGNWHFADMLGAVAEIPRSEGDVKDEAARLVEYLQNPKEEAAGFRSFLFAQFLGGSVAAAMVNLTQPMLMTYPYLQRHGATPASMLRAARIASGGVKPSGNLAAAIAKATEEGVIAPNEIHQLYAESMRSLGSNIWVRRFMRGWGSLFAVSEAFNRRLTFAAAYEAAEAKGMQAPFEFAVRAVEETQGIYNRGNRPNWARGTIGATVFTFKQFSIAYLEFIARLPRQQQVLALGLLVIAAGAQGLPFADDLDDLIDTIGQSAGYNTNVKRWKRRVLEDAFGKTAGDFVLHGFSALPGIPLDVQARLSVGNLIPGTAVFKRSETDKTRDVMEFLGPAGSVVQSGGKAFGKLQQGDLAGAAMAVAPVAVQNALKAAEMAQMGMYRDSHGRRVIDTDAYDAAIKSIGFQPSKVAVESRRSQEVRDTISMNKAVESDIAERWAQGIFERDTAKVDDARKALIEWNAKNPESPIRIVPQQIGRRVQEMLKTREQRMVKAAPREIRGAVVKELQR